MFANWHDNQCPSTIFYSFYEMNEESPFFELFYPLLSLTLENILQDVLQLIRREKVRIYLSGMPGKIKMQS